MNAAFFSYTFKKKTVALAVIALWIIIYLLCVLSFFEKGSESAMSMFASLPKAALDLMGLNRSSFTDLNTFLDIYFFNLPNALIMTIYCMCFAAPAISDYYESGFADNLLVTKMSRTSFGVTLIVSFLLGLLVLSLAALATPIFWSFATGDGLDIPAYCLTVFSHFCFFALVGAIGFWFSSMFKRSIYSLLSAAVVLVATVGFAYLSRTEVIPEIAFLSLFALFDPINNPSGDFNIAGIGVIIALSFLFFGASILILAKRDVRGKKD